MDPGKEEAIAHAALHKRSHGEGSQSSENHLQEEEKIGSGGAHGGNPLGIKWEFFVEEAPDPGGVISHPRCQTEDSITSHSLTMDITLSPCSALDDTIPPGCISQYLNPPPCSTSNIAPPSCLTEVTAPPPCTASDVARCPYLVEDVTSHPCPVVYIVPPPLLSGRHQSPVLLKHNFMHCAVDDWLIR